jgi:integrase/recombinase XerD
MIEPAFLAPFVRSFFEDHLVCHRNMSPNTIRSYRDALKLLLAFASDRHRRAAAKLRMDDVTDQVVIAFLDHIELNRSNAIQTRNHRLVAIRRLFEYIASREQARRVMTIPRKRGGVLPETGYLEKEQMTALLNAVAKASTRGQRDYAMLRFMYNTGARVQEVADTRVGWLSLVPQFKVELLGKGRKWRTCPLWENTANHLRQLIARQRPNAGKDDFVFVNRYGRPLSRSGIADIVQRYASKAAESLPSLQNRNVTPHTLRHTTAMHLLQSGVEVNVIRSWLGHVSIATTNRYIEIDLAMKAEALAACEVTLPSAGEAVDPRSPDILAWLESL